MLGLEKQKKAEEREYKINRNIKIYPDRLRFQTQNTRKD